MKRRAVVCAVALSLLAACSAHSGVRPASNPATPTGGPSATVDPAALVAFCRDFTYVKLSGQSFAESASTAGASDAGSVQAYSDFLNTMTPAIQKIDENTSADDPKVVQLTKQLSLAWSDVNQSGVALMRGQAAPTFTGDFRLLVAAINASAQACGVPPISRTAASAPPEAIHSAPALVGQGCSSGTVKTQFTDAGLKVTVASKSAFDFDLCVTLPNGSTIRPQTADNYQVVQDDRSQWFEKDSLGHLFFATPPGQIAVTTVVVPAGNDTKIYVLEGSPDTTHNPFTIVSNVSDCNPNCANGHMTSTTYAWSANKGQYVAQR